MDRNVLNVFVASPGDLSQERDLLKQKVERLNKIIGRNLGWHIELFGWEDTLPGANRPQSLINKDVEICDLFIGLLWKRWGQPTGTTDSGFKEEFDIALKRKDNSNIPEIWLYLKKIDSDLLADPGDQLKKVLSFREWLIDSKCLLFKEFASHTQWSELIYDHLLTYIIELNSTKETKIKQDRNSKKEQSTYLKKEEPKRGSIDEFLKIISNKIETNTFFELGYWEKARLMMLGQALYSESHKIEFLGNHELNICYSARNEWILTPTEKFYLLKSSLSYEFDHRPIWFWFKDDNIKTIKTMLVEIIKETNNSQLTYRSFYLLNKFSYEFEFETIWEIISNEDFEHSTKLIESISYNHELLNALLQKDLEAKVLSNHTKKIIVFQLAKVKIKKKPTIEIEKILNSQTHIDDETTKLIIQYIDKIDLSVLQEYVKTSNTKLREAFLKKIFKERLLSKQDANYFLKDNNSNIRRIALEFLIESGQSYSPNEINDICKSILNENDFIIQKSFSKKSFPDLIESIWYLSNNGSIAYKELSETYYNDFKDTIFQNLEDNFKTWFEKSKSSLHNIYSKEIVNSLFDSIDESTKQFVINRYINISLEALNNSNSRYAIKYARKYLLESSDQSIISTSLKLLFNHGKRSDAKLILENFNKFDEKNVREYAIKVALRLAPGIRGIVNTVMTYKNGECLQIGLDYLYTIKPKSRIKNFKDYLYNEDDSIRLKSLFILTSMLSTKQLEKLLNTYPNNGKKYYYDVVTWLDRILYSGEFLSKLYVKEFEKNISAVL